MNRRHNHFHGAPGFLGRRMLAAALTAGAMTAGLVVADPLMLPAAQAQGPVVVPAGQTTTVDVGVPVGVNTTQDGFTIVSSGTSVSVTAPAGGGQTSIPVSYGGYSTVVTIIAEANATGASVDGQSVDEILNDPGLGAGSTDGAPAGSDPTAAAASDAASQNSGSAGNSGSSQAGTEGSSTSDGSVGSGGFGADNPAPRPARGLAPELSSTDVPHVDLQGSIDGTQLVVQLSVTQALNLYNQFGGNDPSSVDVRYVDGDGQLIEGVSRNIDKAARRLTLTYPQGQTPDNPFIIQVLNASDGSAAAVVTITSPGKLTTKQGGTAVVNDSSATSDRNFYIAIAAVALVILALLGGIIASVRKARRRRARRG